MVLRIPSFWTALQQRVQLLSNLSITNLIHINLHSNESYQWIRVKTSLNDRSTFRISLLIIQVSSWWLSVAVDLFMNPNGSISNTASHAVRPHWILVHTDFQTVHTDYWSILTPRHCILITGPYGLPDSPYWLLVHTDSQAVHTAIWSILTPRQSILIIGPYWLSDSPYWLLFHTDSQTVRTD